MGSEKPKMNRRNFFTGLGAIAGTISLPAFKLEAQENIDESRLLALPKTFEYDVDRVGTLLASEYQIQDLPDQDLEELFKLAQSLFQNLFYGDIVQEQLAKTFPNVNDAIDVIIATNDSETGLDEQGLFVHGEGNNHSKIYIREGVSIPEAMDTLLHEMMHGAYGSGEVHAQFYNMLAQMVMYANGKVPHSGLILKNNFALSRLYSRELDASALLSMEYLTLPMTVVIMTAHEIENHPVFSKYSNEPVSPSMLTKYINIRFFSTKDDIDKIKSFTDEVLVIDGQLDTKHFLDEFLIASEVILQFINKDSGLPKEEDNSEVE